MIWLEQFTITLFTAFLSTFFLMLAFRHRWGKWAEWLQSEEMAKLSQKVTELSNRLQKTETILEDTRSERDTLRVELLDAQREIKALQRRLEDIETSRTSEGIRILGVWSIEGGPPLDLVGEMTGIYNSGLEYIPLYGSDATRGNILQRLRQDHPTILEIGGHGKTSGVPLADGLAEPGWWERTLRDRVTIRAVLLLSCYSDSALYDAIRRALPNARIISVTGEITDVSAVAFAKAFYNNYANGMEIVDAVDQAKLIVDHKEAGRIRQR